MIWDVIVPAAISSSVIYGVLYAATRRKLSDREWRVEAAWIDLKDEQSDLEDQEAVLHYERERLGR